MFKKILYWVCVGVAFLGFMLILGAAGNNDCNIGTLRGNMMLSVAGLLLFAVGILLARQILFFMRYKLPYQREKALYPPNLDIESANIIAYNPNLERFMKLVGMNGTRDWTYVWCNTRGEVVGKQELNYSTDLVSNYDWKIPE